MKIVILAISKKLNGYCVAGKEIRRDGSAGHWVRPITRHREHGVVWLNDMKYPDGSLPRLLDIVEIPMEPGRADGPAYQTENRWALQQSWTKVGAIEKGQVDRIAKLEDTPEHLWVAPVADQRNDRIPLLIAEGQVTSSLLLVRAAGLSAFQEPGFNGRGINLRVSFRYFAGSFRLKWTIQGRLRDESLALLPPFGEAMVSDQPAWVCVSLGEPYRGDAYRLAAAVIGPDFPV